MSHIKDKEYLNKKKNVLSHEFSPVVKHIFQLMLKIYNSEKHFVSILTDIKVPSSKVWQMSYKSIRHFGMKKL